MLSIKHLLDILENAKNVEALLVRSKNINVVVCSPIIDYWGCLDTLEDPSLCELTLAYKKIAPIKQLQFKEVHLQQGSHSLKAQPFKCIVNILKPWLPNKSQEDLTPY